MGELRPAEYLEKFEAEWQMVSGMAHRVSKIDELESVLEKILEDSESSSLVVSRNPILKELRIAERLSAKGKNVTSWEAGAGTSEAHSLEDFNKTSFAAGAGITGVDFVLAESGTLVLTSATEGAQVSSLAPPIHIALFRQHQIVGSLDEVLAMLPISSSPTSPSPNRSVVFITGTSRTADIEQILIRGVHGPREAHAILVEDSCR
jgi:L-lactate dehydrogenase complex protein LldG